MSKVKLIYDVVSDLRALADSVEAVADAIVAHGSAAGVNLPEAKQVTLEEVRAVLAEKSHAGFTAEVRALLEKYGAAKLSEVEPSQYAELLADAEGLH